MENNLKILSMYYNEPLIYCGFAKLNKVKVHIVPIDYELAKDKKDNMIGRKPYHVIIRVSALVQKIENKDLFHEIKWEGLLQDWYRACAETVEKITC